MTVVNWYEPIDPWMREKIANAIREESKWGSNEVPVAAACFLILNHTEKLKYPEQVSMYSLERLIREYTADTDLLKRTAQNSALVFNLNEPEDYQYAVC